MLRLRAGEEIRLIDGNSIWAAELTEVSDKGTAARITAALPSPEAPCKAILWQGLPKADKLELIVQKSTELGVKAVLPVAMEYCIAKADKGDRDEKKRERLQRIALEAAKQSGRACIPEVNRTVSFAEAMKIAQECDLVLIAWEEEHALSMFAEVRQYVQANGIPGKVMIIIGPEGGISAAEVEKLKNIGAKPVTLGPRILRTETAGLCALSVLWTALGEM